MDTEKTTIKTAAKALGVSERSIQRYIKQGLLTKIKEGTNIFLLSDEIRQLRQNKTGNRPTNTKSNDSLNVVTISSDKYDKMVSELGQLQERCSNLLEYRLIQEKLKKEVKLKDKKIVELKNNAKTVICQKDVKIQKLQQNVGNASKFILETDDTNKKLKNILVNKDNQIDDLQKNLDILQKELQKHKSRNIFQRIFNK